MEYIQKAGIKHPSEAVVIYSLKRATPDIFGDGIGSGIQKTPHVQETINILHWIRPYFRAAPVA